MTKIEQSVREDISTLNKVISKLNFLRQEIIPVYGLKMTIKELENELWRQHNNLEYNIHEAFDNIEKIEKNQIQKDIKNIAKLLNDIIK